MSILADKLLTIITKNLTTKLADRLSTKFALNKNKVIDEINICMGIKSNTL